MPKSKAKNKKRKKSAQPAAGTPDDVIWPVLAADLQSKKSKLTNAASNAPSNNSSTSASHNSNTTEYAQNLQRSTASMEVLSRLPVIPQVIVTGPGQDHQVIGQGQLVKGRKGAKKKKGGSHHSLQKLNAEGMESDFFNPDFVHSTSGWTRHVGHGFDLELWWRRSGMKNRLNAGLVMLLLAVFLINLVFAFYCLGVAFQTPRKDPYLCQTEECHKAAVWMGATMNLSVDPCENFYEFVCGSYPNERGKRRGDQFRTLIQAPGFQVGFGKESILASILKDFRNDSTLDQSIHYYRACLNMGIRKEFGLTAFVDTVEYIFGTRDLSKFEGFDRSLEEVGRRMFQVLGHASFLNMAFFSYPFIQILRPTYFAENVYFAHTDAGDGTSWDNELFVARILDHLLPVLGVPSGCPLYQEMLQGIGHMAAIISGSRAALRYIQLDKNLETILKDPQFVAAVQDNVIQKGLCPPAGLPLDMHHILRLFIQDDFRMDFIDLTAAKHYAALQLCFDQPPSSFTALTLTNPRSAFVGLWLLELFWDYHQSMDSLEILHTLNLTTDEFPNNMIIIDRFEEVNGTHEEFLCLVSLYRHLSYLPSIRYLVSLTDNPPELINSIEKEIMDMFRNFSDIFARIPSSEISRVSAHLGQIQFARPLVVDVGLPLVNGILDGTVIDEPLYFTEDHLRNAIIATNYTIENARVNWIASVDAEPIIQWWGSGGPSDIRAELLDLRTPMHQPARFKENMKFPGKGNGAWEKFLGRRYPNYILYPLSLIGEPHVSETMALHYGGHRQKILRSLLSLPEHQFLHDRYPSLETHELYLPALEDVKMASGEGRKCAVLFNEKPLPNRYGLYYTTTMFTNRSTFAFSASGDGNYDCIVSLKESFRQFREDRDWLMKQPYNWTWSKRDKEFRMRGRLPGKMEAFKDEQLYFIAWVRHTCRGSFKVNKDEFVVDRWLLEMDILYVLMQMEEFGRVWGCGRNAVMNNLGLPRCMRWVPDVEERK